MTSHNRGASPTRRPGRRRKYGFWRSFSWDRLRQQPGFSRCETENRRQL